MNESWTRVLSLEELAVGAACTVRAGGEQIAVFRVDEQTVRAVDNRCPHEGYPLTQGYVRDGVLTCAWHNWKFRLGDGACVLGGEAVRAYPVKLEDGAVFIDLKPPPRGDQIPRLLGSLIDSFEEADWGHAGRAIARLLALEVAPSAILGPVCAWAANHAPYGFDHGLAVATDLGRLLDDPLFAGEAEVLLLEAISSMVEPNVRRPERVWLEPALPRPDAGSELRRLIEAEEREAAEALMRGALERGAGFDQAFRWLTRAATDHFLDFGHAHIYCVKAEELLDVIGDAFAHPILTCLVSSIAYGTREDTLSYMKRYRKEMEGVGGRLSAWAARDRSESVELDVDVFVASVLDGALSDALGAVVRGLEDGVAPDRIALALAVCAAERMMRFDAELELRDDVSEGWLDVTHGMTHADAVRESLRRRPDAELLRGLFHSARFVNHTAPLDAPVDRQGDRTGAIPTMDELVRGVIDDRLAVPIFVAHHVKQVMAARRLEAALRADPQLGERERLCELPRRATARFVASPLQQRRIRRRAIAATRFVKERKLTTRLLGY